MKQNKVFSFDEKARQIIDEAAKNQDYTTVIEGICAAMAVVGVSMFKAYRKYAK